MRRPQPCLDDASVWRLFSTDFMGPGTAGTSCSVMVFEVSRSIVSVGVIGMRDEFTPGNLDGDSEQRFTLAGSGVPTPLFGSAERRIWSSPALNWRSVPRACSLLEQWVLLRFRSCTNTCGCPGKFRWSAELRASFGVMEACSTVEKRLGLPCRTKPSEYNRQHDRNSFQELGFEQCLRFESGSL